MKNNNHLNDEQLKQLIAESKANIEIPEPSNWEQVHTEILKKAKKKKRWLTIKQIASISAAAVLISFFINNNSGTQVSAQFTNFFKVLKNEATFIFLSDKQNKNENSGHSPNLDKISPILANNKDLQMALSQLDYTPSLPKYIPDEFIVDEVYVVNLDADNTLNIYLTNDKNQYLSISYKNYSSQYTTIRDPNLTDSTYEDMQIGNYMGILIDSVTHGYTIDWVDQNNVKTTMRSNLDRVQFIKILRNFY